VEITGLFKAQKVLDEKLVVKPTERKRRMKKEDDNIIKFNKRPCDGMVDMNDSKYHAAIGRKGFYLGGFF